MHSEKIYDEEPTRNACGGYYCSEEFGHVDCKLGPEPEEDDVMTAHELRACGGDCPECQRERAEHRELSASEP